MRLAIVISFIFSAETGETLKFPSQIPPPSLLSICIFCLLSFFWLTFFFSGSEAAGLLKACSRSTSTTSMWHGEDM